MAEEDIKMEEAQQNAQEADSKAKGPKLKDKKNSELQKKCAELESQVASLNDKLSGEHDSYVRLMAEFETFRRRSAEDKLSLVSNAAADTIKGLLPVLDDCERAMQMLATSSDEAAREGTSLIYNKLMEYLKTRGLTVIEAKGAKFDTDFHEAVTQIPAPDESLKGAVMDVVQTGYMLNGKVLRYAKVVVGC